MATSGYAHRPAQASSTKVQGCTGGAGGAETGAYTLLSEVEPDTRKQRERLSETQTHRLLPPSLAWVVLHLQDVWGSVVARERASKMSTFTEASVSSDAGSGTPRGKDIST